MNPGTDVLDAYAPAPDSYDEMVAPGGEVRDHWSLIGGSLAQLGVDELRARRRESNRLLDEDGVTYNVYQRDGKADARWAFDPVPAVVSSKEWAEIERGVIERSELLNLVLTDLYGPRDLLRTGVLPPELVCSDPGFLRQCDGVRIPGAVQLVTAGFDLARRAAGGHIVLADRVQAPSGFGYALQSRVLTSRVFPSLYRDNAVHRLAPFFRTLRGALLAAAPAGVSDPRVVVLTPGPLSEAAFEQALLARYLGYPLVEGADLRVRGGRVWLRSVGRLEPVDVILRRLDASYCDPVELRPDSQLGVPGLVEACRQGTVSVVNPLGCGAVESPGLLPFLPALSTALLGHDLALPSVDAWWCGDETGRRFVLAHLEHMVMKSIGQPRGTSGRPVSVAAWNLSAEERADLRLRIEADPNGWVGVEHVELATTPTSTDRGIEPRRTTLRAFTVALGASYTAMPGGLTRVAPDSESSVISNQGGAISKDTWVLASEPELLTGFWLRGGPAVEAVPPEGSMSSRAAENLFWLGRYAERAESLVRLLRVVLDRRNEFQHGGNVAGTECLSVLSSALGAIAGIDSSRASAATEERLALAIDLRAMVVDEGRTGTLAYASRRLVEAAETVRDQLSSDTWPILATLKTELLGPAAETRAGVARGTLSRALQALLALSGLAAENMVRDPGWQFMEAGRRIERGLQLVELLRATVVDDRGTATDSLVLESVLTTTESIITYRRRYRSQAQVETLLDLLLLDPNNPRSLATQIALLEVAVGQLPDHGADGHLSPAERVVVEASAAVRLADTAVLSTPGADGRRPELASFFANVAALLGRIGATVSGSHFVALVPQQSLLPQAAGAPSTEDEAR